MKSRAIKSLFWDKRIEHSYSSEAAYLYLYLLTCKHIGLTPYFLLVEQYIELETGLKPAQIAKSKEELTSKGQVYFYKHWVFILNADEHNNYNISPKTRKAYERELATVPKDVMQAFSELNCGKLQTNIEEKESKDIVDNDMVSIPYRYGMDTSNTNTNNNTNNNLVSNKKEISKNIPTNKKERAKSELTEAANLLIGAYNETFGKKLKTGVALVANLEYWLQTYDLAEITDAIKKSKSHKFWGDKMTPEILLRRKNPQGECVDRIGEMLNYQPAKAFANENKGKYDNL